MRFFCSLMKNFGITHIFTWATPLYYFSTLEQFWILNAARDLSQVSGYWKTTGQILKAIDMPKNLCKLDPWCRPENHIYGEERGSRGCSIWEGTGWHFLSSLSSFPCFLMLGCMVLCKGPWAYRQENLLLLWISQWSALCELGFVLKNLRAEVSWGRMFVSYCISIYHQMVPFFLHGSLSFRFFYQFSLKKSAAEVGDIWPYDKPIKAVSNI